MDPQEFRKKVVIVTGGGSGIGKAAALAFSRHGASVVVANRNRYSASKSAVIMLTKSAAMEYTRKGIRINAVVPGRVETPMMLGSRIADMSAVAEGLPIGRLGKPEEVARAVLWLASGEASFVVGHALVTDGGFLSA